MPNTCNIKVGVRMRPLIASEAMKIPKWICAGKSVVSVESPGDGNKYVFDQVFDSTASNNEIFTSIVKPLIHKAIEGYNATILAYGQTSSGKTYTLMGDENIKGVIPLTCNHLFQSIENFPTRTFLFSISFLEVYNEKIRDLLALDQNDLLIFVNSDGMIKVNCRSVSVTDVNQMLDLLEQGNQHKTVKKTNCNERSSRSHTVFMITVESREKSATDKECAKVSHINLVDLAGSEKAAQAGTSGQCYKDGCAINRSLLMLGQVMQKLSEGRGQYINYRDSKLTRLLQPSLSGNALMVLICNITSVAVKQTQHSLEFASRAMSIKLSPHLNLVKPNANENNQLESNEKKIEGLEEENKKMQKEIKMLREVVESRLNCKQNQERALRRHTWGSFQLQSQPFPLGPVSDRFLHLDHGDVTSVSSKEQPCSMSLESTFSIGSNISTRVSLDPETPPSVLRSQILQLQKKLDNSTHNWQKDRETLSNKLKRAELDLNLQKISLDTAEEDYQDILKSYKENRDMRLHFEEEVCRLEFVVEELQAKIAAYEKEAHPQETNPEISQQSLAHFQQELHLKSARLVELEREAEDSKHVKAKYEAESQELHHVLADLNGQLEKTKERMKQNTLMHDATIEALTKELTYQENMRFETLDDLKQLRNQLEQQDATFPHDGSRQRVQSATQATQTSSQQGTCSVAVQAPPDNETLWDLASSAITESGRIKQQMDDMLARNRTLEAQSTMFKDELRKRDKKILEMQRTQSDLHRMLASNDDETQRPMDMTMPPL